jgi:hypothetical protein
VKGDQVDRFVCQKNYDTSCVLWSLAALLISGLSLANQAFILPHIFLDYSRIALNKKSGCARRSPIFSRFD